MSRLSIIAWALLVAGCADAQLGDEAPTQLRDVEVDGGVVRVAPLGEAIAVAWQDGTTGTTTAILLDGGLQESWRTTVGDGLPLRLRARDDRIYILAAGELFVLSSTGELVAQWAVPDAVDFALTSDGLFVLESGGVVQLDDAGSAAATLPVDPAFTSPWSLEASAKGYCPTGYLDQTDNTTTCFGWDGAQTPVRLSQPGSKPSAERDFVALSDDGIVSMASGSSISAVQLTDGRIAGAYEPEQGSPAKTFVGPDGRTMWLELEQWCADNCYHGFRLGLLDASRTHAAWRTDLFAVESSAADLWSVVVDGDRVLVATDRHVYVVSGE